MCSQFVCLKVLLRNLLSLQNRRFSRFSEFESGVQSLLSVLRACSHEPGTVNYPGVMIAPGQALPRVHMMICCPGATLPRVNFIAPG